ncbi:MAG TPA: amino acid ABC transporter substrate-binding protein [Myxococcales bacterium]|jgi:ABC-type amino acid transport substrate-binding protein|nr:amino acid ABC transporter substrate-binding protein [Myxococcales bacterium]
MRIAETACAALLLAAGCATARLDASSRNTLDQIRYSKVIKLGYRESAVPFSFVGIEGKPGGYSVDLCTAVVEGLAKDLSLGELRIEWVKVTPETRIDALLVGSIDLECGSTTSTYSRQELVDFTNFTFLDGATFMSRVGAGIRSVDDLSGKRVALIPGTTTERILKEALNKAGVTSEFVSVKINREGLRAVSDGTADVYASDRTILLSLAATSSEPDRYAIVDRPLSFEPYALMLRHDPAFRLAVNRQLSRIYRSGSIMEIYGKWFGKFGPVSDAMRTMYAISAAME